MNTHHRQPPSNGLYSPEFEHDACGMGFVTQIKGVKSRGIVEQGLQLLERLSHRAAVGADPETGDGAGILLQLPHRFFKRVGLELGLDMPRRRRYGVGQFMLPQDPAQRRACEQIIEAVIAEEGQKVLGWRDVPVDPSQAGRVARDVLPAFRQVYVARRRLPPSAFERVLYVIRKRFEARIHEAGVDPDARFHCASLSAETIVYKGLLLPRQLSRFYADLRDPDLVSAIALVHSRFSTNTFATWDLAQPFRYICHNGEINTLRGNRNWMAARRSLLQSAKFPGGVERLGQIIVPGRSDSAQFDNMLELLHLGGRSLPHAVMMMIPEAWEGNPQMPEARRDFYRYAETLLEPWDGPAAIAFSDGLIVGATLDRNGLRPARYLITEDDRVILASETGVIDVPPEMVRAKGRLQPGRMLVIDTEQGRIVDDGEVKADIVSRYPYGRWLAKNTYPVDRAGSEPVHPDNEPFYGIPPFPEADAPEPIRGEALQRLQRAFGYSDEDVQLILQPMAATGKEPIGAMGDDTPLAVLSDRAPVLCRYFHQLFAQVTNPPIDPIREALVMSLQTSIGPDGNTFDETPEQCHRLVMDSPILSNERLAKIAAIQEGVFEPTRLSLLWAVADGSKGLVAATEALCARASEAVDEGYNLLILSDRGVDQDHAPIPALLAVSAVHQHLVRDGSRLQTGLVLETGEAREVHDFACLIGYGIAAINPYLALDAVRGLAEDGLAGDDADVAEARFTQAICGGLRKVMSKMGISTVLSYRGAQIFEAVGLDKALVERHFTGTPSRLGGIGLEGLGREALERHARGFAGQGSGLPVGGDYRWRRRGERHQWNPATVAALQRATATGEGDADLFEAFSRLVDEDVDDAPSTLRGMLRIVEAGVQPVPLDEVESVASICTRFVTGAMSFGSLSAEAHETLAIAMNRIGGRSNSGEGGEEARRYVPDDNGDDRSSKIKQVASGRFGVTTAYLVNALDLQIKVAQGAKPGEGGQLPGHKVDARIAAVRNVMPGVTLISPPPHHDIYSIEDLAQLIYDLQAVNPMARISVKLVSEVGVGTIAAGVAKAHAGAVVIAGASGGTGASPLSSLKHAGLPWELGLAETQQVLTQNNLRGRIRVQVDGGMRTGRDLAVATLLGAEEWGIATAALVVEGCIMLRKCHTNTCSVGIATQDPRLRARFAGTPEQVVAYFLLVAGQLRQVMAGLGLRTVDEMVGRVDLLEVRPDLDHWKATALDLSPLLAPAAAPKEWPRRFIAAVPFDLADHLDHRILAAAEPAIARGERVEIALPIENANRAVGTLLSGEIARRQGEVALPDDVLHVSLTGSAGQSFGAFLVAGVTLALEGDANDYLGKGLSGGRIVVRPPAAARFVAEDNIIVGNVVLYGATAGEIFVAGRGGERFAVRNSGARAVIEGVGDHGCEYMTGGVAVILGPTGRNFAAGMSGGTAYVWDRQRQLRGNCNLAMVSLEALPDDSEAWMVKALIADHVRYTGSVLGQRLIDQWAHVRPQFVKVVPTDDTKRLEADARTPPGVDGLGAGPTAHAGDR